MTRQDAGRTAWLSVVFYILGGLWLFAGFAVLVVMAVVILLTFAAVLTATLAHLSVRPRYKRSR